jgi:hypothetical protein
MSYLFLFMFMKKKSFYLFFLCLILHLIECFNIVGKVLFNFNFEFFSIFKYLEDIGVARFLFRRTTV